MTELFNNLLNLEMKEGRKNEKANNKTYPFTLRDYRKICRPT